MSHSLVIAVTWYGRHKPSIIQITGNCRLQMNNNLARDTSQLPDWRLRSLSPIDRNWQKSTRSHEWRYAWFQGLEGDADLSQTRVSKRHQRESHAQGLSGRLNWLRA